MPARRITAEDRLKIRGLVLGHLRREWSVSLVFFLLMFCSCVIPVLLDVGTEYSYGGELAGMILAGHWPFFIIFIFLHPVFAGMSVYRYHHKQGVAVMTHALPTDRRTLYSASFIAGLILTFVPVILIALSLLPIVPMYPDDIVDQASYWFTGNTVTSGLSAIAIWFCWLESTLVIILTELAISLFCGTLTGRLAAHFMLTCILNFLPLLLCLITFSYLDAFIVGFSIDSTPANALIMHLHPLVTSTAYAGLSALSALCYIAASAAIIFATLCLYKHKRIERIGDPLTFKGSEVVIGILIPLLFMTFTGALFGLTDESLATLITGCVVGAIPSFLIVRMMLRKTPRIWNRQTLRIFAAFGIVCVMFIVLTVCDITGYSYRIPATQNVKSASITFQYYPFAIPYNSSYLSTSEHTIELTDAGEIEQAARIQRIFIDYEQAERDSRLYDEPNDYDFGYGTDVTLGKDTEHAWNYSYGGSYSGNVTITYNRYVGMPFERVYSVSNDLIPKSAAELILNLEDFRDTMALENLI